MSCKHVALSQSWESVEIPVFGILWEDDDPYMLLSGFLKLCISIWVNYNISLT